MITNDLFALLVVGTAEVVPTCKPMRLGAICNVLLPTVCSDNLNLGRWPSLQCVSVLLSENLSNTFVIQLAAQVVVLLRERGKLCCKTKVCVYI